MKTNLDLSFKTRFFFIILYLSGVHGKSKGKKGVGDIAGGERKKRQD